MDQFVSCSLGLIHALHALYHSLLTRFGDSLLSLRFGYSYTFNDLYYWALRSYAHSAIQNLLYIRTAAHSFTRSI